MKYKTLLLFIILFCKNSSAQSEYEVVQKAKNETPTFITFSGASTITHFNFLEKLNKEFSARKEDGLVLYKTTKDKQGFTHYKLNQTYKGIVVFGAQYIIHEKEGKATSANGKFISKLNIDINPQISKDVAIKSAMKSIGLTQYRWEEKKFEDALKKRTKDPKATYYPKPELVISPTEGNYKKGEFFLCWKFNVSGIALDKAWTVFVDAKNGTVINKISMVTNDFSGIGQTYYNGNKSIKCAYNSGFGVYLLEEYQRGSSFNQQIYTWTMNNDTLPFWGSVNSIGSATTTFSSDPVANNVHWGIEQAYDFYALFSRQSFDDNGTYILNLVHYDVNLNNAFWNGIDTVMCYGDGDGVQMDYVVALDIAGHEYTHAVTQYSANLQYQAESGALNESFSDILGTGIEWYALGAGSNWSIGEDIMVSATCLRSLSNPALGLTPQPDTYLGTYWNPTAPVTAANDYGGVHTNSGIQNYWFYLLASGGSGVNDNGDSYSVVGIGMSDALNIVYRNLTVYLGTTSDFTDAMNGSIASAIDFWGASSQQVSSVKSAWCAVGVGSCLTTDIDESNSSFQVSVYPNPNDGTFTLSADAKKIKELFLFNTLGEKINKFHLDENANNNSLIQINTGSNGVYFLEIHTIDGQKITKKIILNK